MELSGLSGRSLSWLLLHEATRSITSPPPPPPSLLLMHEAFTSIISPPPPFLDGMLVQPIPFPNEQKKTGFTESLPVNLNSWVERSPTRVNCLASQLNITVTPPCLLDNLSHPIILRCMFCLLFSIHFLRDRE